ncbi:incP-type conjugative transfer protein trbL [Vibrio ishigakensis]|uniref:IncP-type conjugative transfer protein trbL n=1 Tax=Vibrio ishigakensis TaxID=1481914 RepID=A0A0B8PS78_9VIBR|nr:incP-type conjugative transfer protein trbL [Vibrio ishigakensis]
MLKILSLLSLLFSPYALAANNDLDTLLEKFNTLTSAWEPIIIEAVTGLFWLLVILSFTWGAIQLWIRQAGLDEIIAELFERIFTIGFCWFLLNNAASLAWYLMNSVQEVVTRLSGEKKV